MDRFSVLLTGNIGRYTYDIAEVLKAASCHITISSRSIKQDLNENSIREIAMDDKLRNLSSLYSSGGFDTVIYFFGCKSEAGNYPENTTSLYGRCLDELRQHLQQFKTHKEINQFILITDNRGYGRGQIEDEDTKPYPDSDAGIYMCLAERELRLYSKADKDRHWLLIRTTHIYSTSHIEEFIADFYREDAMTEDKVYLQGFPEDSCKFIASKDVGVFLASAIEESTEGIVHLVGPEAVKYSDLAALFVKAGKKPSYIAPMNRTTPLPELDWERAYRDYHWVPRERLTEYLPGKKHEVEKPSFWQKFKNFMEKMKKLIPWIETILGAIILQLILKNTEGNTLLSSVDYRLFFVIIIGSAHGTMFGMISGFFAYLSFCFFYLKTGEPWDLLLNMDNWLPFVIYLTAGGLTGYLKSSNDSKVEELEDTIDNKENEYAYLKDLHQQTCDMRDSLQEQVINSRDSYGKIYNMVSELDSLYPDEVILRTVQIFEDILDSANIEIYQRESNQRYIRKLVESKGSDFKANSLNLEKYPLLKKSVEEHELFTNKEFLEGYPSYCITIEVTQSIDIIIAISKAQPNQYTKYYQNLIRIVAQLAKIALAKAVIFLNSPTRYVNGTIFLKQTEFLQSWNVRHQIMLEGSGEHLTLKFTNTLPDDILSERIRSSVRATDVAGKMDNGDRYIIMMQATEANSQQIIGRLAAKGITASVVPESEIAAYGK